MCPDHFNKNVISANRLTIKVNHMNEIEVFGLVFFFTRTVCKPNIPKSFGKVRKSQAFVHKSTSNE